MKNNKINTQYPRIEELRKQNNQKQSDIADKLEMHLTQYRRYEKAETPVTADFILKIALLYNVSADYILGLTEEQKKYW